MKTFYYSLKRTALVAGLALAMPLAASAAAVGDDFTTADGLKYEILADGEVALVANGYSGTVNVPASVEHEGETYAVTTIGNGADVFMSGVTAVILPEGLTTINTYAFSMAGITELTLPSTLTTINSVAFWQCMGLSELVIPDKVEAVPSMCFFACGGLYKLTLGESVKSVGAQAFTGCGALSDLVVKATTPPQLDEQIFGTDGMAKASIVTVTVPAGTLAAYQEAWGSFGFADIVEDEGGETPGPEVTEFTVDGLTYEKIDDGTEVALIACGSEDAEVAVPATVDYEDVTYSVTTIGNGVDNVFATATTVTIPEGVTTIRSRAFNESPVVTLNLPASLTTLEQSAFIYSELKELAIPDGVETIPDRCFMGCGHLTKITFGASVKSIGVNAALTCGSLATLVFTTGVPPTLDESSFQYPGSITVYAPMGCKDAYLKEYGDYGFKAILENGETPSGIDEIEADALTCTVTANGIRLSDDIADVATVYTLSGQVVASCDCSDGFIPASLQPGVYLLRVGNVTLKVMAR